MSGRRAALVAIGLLCALGACGGPGRVRFEHETCFIDDRPASLFEVQAREAEVNERMLARQPLLVLITVLIVALAGMSHVEKLVLLFSARRSDEKRLGDRLRAALDRYRAHPLRYFAIVGVTFTLLLVAGSLYIYLDADKRASERALSTLQFCHLALRTAEEQGVLDEQRRNLSAIQATAGDIRSLVGKLPPEEQAKARLIIDELTAALGRQGKIVSQSVQRSDETTKALREHAQVVEKDLSILTSGLQGLKGLPAGVDELHGELRELKGRLTAEENKAAGLDSRLATIDAALKELAARPEHACPACVCGGAAQADAAAKPVR